MLAREGKVHGDVRRKIEKLSEDGRGGNKSLRGCSVLTSLSRGSTVADGKKGKEIL
jgi:hypothetical protein